MSDLITKLNEILADEWACVRTLRRAESRCDDAGQKEMLKRVRKDCSVNCVTLTNVIRTLGGRPTDAPSPRFSRHLTDESLAEIIDLAQVIQQNVIDEIATVLDESGLRTTRHLLDLVQQMHTEDIRWLKAVGAT